MSEDTYFGDPADALSLNLYTYCSNNPLIYWDPTGHDKSLQVFYPDGRTSVGNASIDSKGNIKAPSGATGAYINGEYVSLDNLDNVVRVAKGTIDRHYTNNDGRSAPSSLTIQVNDSIVELYDIGDGFYGGNYYGHYLTAGTNSNGTLYAGDGIVKFLKDSDDIKRDYIKDTGFYEKMADPNQSVFLEPGLSDVVLTFLRESVAGQNGSLDLAAVAGWQNQSQAKAINGAVRKLTGVHGDPNLDVDNYLLIGLETVAMENAYTPSASYVIDDQMYSFISDMAHYTQYEIDNAVGYNWTKWHEETIASRAIMADTALDAARIGAVIVNAEAWRDNPENFSKFKAKEKAGKAGNAKGTGNQKIMTGEEWNEYFKQTYGADNVTWKANSFEHIVRNPEVLYGATQAEISNILGSGWTEGTYGSAGTGWKYTNGDLSVFYHPGGGVHGGSYHGFSSGVTGKVKVVGEGYMPTATDGATVIQIGK
jgi:hypothetical protein